MEPPHGAAVEELEHPALLEIKSSSAGPTVWSEFSDLAAETGAINLGQVYQQLLLHTFSVSHVAAIITTGRLSRI